MAQLALTVNGKKVQFGTLLSRQALLLLSDSMVLSIARPYINIRGLIASSTCAGYWLLYKGAVRVGDMRIVGK